LSACARGPNPKDPYEHYNRNAYRLNKKLDTLVLKPVAEGYRDLVPYAIRSHVTNFFNNLDTTRTIGNDILQARVYWTFNDTWRLIINSTIGVLGIFDPATPMGLTQHTNYFDLTLHSWGDTNPPYVVLPFIGPSTTAGIMALPIDYALTPWRYELNPAYLSTLLYGVDIINSRAYYLDQEDLASQLSFDPYIFMRSAFLQNRAYLAKINANPPIKNTLAAHEAVAAVREHQTSKNHAIN